jgi:hypothetical protein
LSLRRVAGEENIPDREATSEATVQAEANGSQDQLQLALPLPEVLKLVQEGPMKLALAAFTAWPKS